jgi:hypothetical protein
MGWMKRALIVAATVWSAAPVASAQDLRPLTRSEQKAFDACVFRAWVNDYCRARSFGIIWDRELSFRNCVVANRGRLEDIPGYVQFGESAGIRTNCWRLAQSGYRR